MKKKHNLMINDGNKALRPKEKMNDMDLSIIYRKI